MSKHILDLLSVPLVAVFSFLTLTLASASAELFSEASSLLLDTRASLSDSSTVAFGNGSSSLSIVPLLTASTAGKSKLKVLEELREENEWKNDLVLFWLSREWRDALPEFLEAWLRNFIASVFLYFGVSGLWAYYIYFCFGEQLFQKKNIPDLWSMLEQAKVSTIALPLYSALPAFNEYIASHGWTRAYARISDVGLGWYFLYFYLYMAIVEFGVYWAHRSLHEIKLGYKYIHHTHHKYNKENTLSPFAGLAFNPFDGVMQAFPYTLAMFVVPMHFMTHELLLFTTAIWTTNIHDCLHGKMEPIMGAGYHTIHHTTYKHNYGQYFVFMDALFGTLVTPEEYETGKAK